MVQRSLGLSAAAADRPCGRVGAVYRPPQLLHRRPLRAAAVYTPPMRPLPRGAPCSAQACPMARARGQECTLQLAGGQH